MKNIVNIINFVRGIEPREGRPWSLYEPVKEQVRLARENNLPSTFLLQYDAYTNDEYIELMKSCEDIAEIGIWFEVVQPLVEKIGEQWRGRYPWDWYNDVGFLIGYAPDVRLRLIDEAMNEFKRVFGYYPKSVGSWHIDAVSMKYLSEKYDILASCICRDQVGTDGYTMQGGYYNQAYYPSVYNMFCPANSIENQINLPVFRMLGSDVIYAYDYQALKTTPKCATLEPAGYGKVPEWVDWFFDETFSGFGLTMQYTQAGQENSFGWHRFGEGLEYQYPYIRKLLDEGKIEVLTLADSGKWFKDNFDITPPSTVTALSDWFENKRKSVWYNSRYYRSNIFWDDGIVRFRDIYVFNDEYKEKYYDKPCETIACEFRNLPVVDGAMYSNAEKSIYAGIYFADENGIIKWDDLIYSENGLVATVELVRGKNSITIEFNEKSFEIKSDIESLKLISVYDKNSVYGNIDTANSTFANKNNRTTQLTYINKAIIENDNKVIFEFDGMEYSVLCSAGTVDSDFNVVSDNGNIVVEF